MPTTEEQRTDIIENCNILLNKFADHEQTDSTPEGRFIAQLNWLKERAESHDLPLPIDRVNISTLAYIYTDGTLSHHASSKDKIRAEIEIPMQRILRLTKKGQLLLKPAYHPYVIRCIDALINTLQNATRPLDNYEQGFNKELAQLKSSLSEQMISPPIGGHSLYPNSIEAENSIEDIPGALALFRLVDNALFNGVRPDNWLTPKDADKETMNFSTQLKT